MIAYFDCFSGISGDMILGALTDLGVPPPYLEEGISRLPLPGIALRVERVFRHGIGAAGVSVVAESDPPHREYRTIRSLIQNAPLPGPVKTRSLSVFHRLAEAEAEIHGCDIETVHFHEVGGDDAIADIVGCALGLSYLNIEAVYASPLPLGRGFVKCRHGMLPLPAPAVSVLLRDVPVYGVDISSELVTPTGAAVISTLADSFGPIPPMRLSATGYGAGKREFTRQPNLLRIMTGEFAAEPGETVSVLETVIDDMNPEAYGHLMDRLFAEGALDVAYIPVYGKKNRPAVKVEVVVPVDRRETLLHTLLSESTTLGVRFADVRRKILKREMVTVQTRYGPVSAKRVFPLGGGVRIVPEYEECRRIAMENNLSLLSVFAAVERDIATAENEQHGSPLTQNP